MRTRTSNPIRAAWVPALLLLALAACDGRAPLFSIGAYYYPAAGLTQWELPPELREISGLTLDPAGRLFAHADEAAVIVELDYRAGRAVKRFTLGDPPVTGDFEGIAWADGRLFLVTSDGALLAAEEAADGGSAAYRRHYTGLGARCEIEGLDYDPARRLLLMACKKAREKTLEKRLAVLAWSLDRLTPAPEHDLVAAWPDGDMPLPNPSGLTRSPANGNLVLAAAKQGALLELLADGTIFRAVTLPGKHRHPQMEGIAMTPSGDLIIADEGRDQRGRLSVYRARQ